MSFEEIVKRVSKESGEDYLICSKIALFQFKSIVKLMKDPGDTRDILINKLFKFKLKKRYKNNKQLKYTAK